mmetsp:Transcript_1739/g.3271  ORF Transcript_1739/g.3271 Transcript_1739/m.3271 type:complete len:215 (+) Transcript_1739:2343-2987(+)
MLIVIVTGTAGVTCIVFHGLFILHFRFLRQSFWFFQLLLLSFSLWGLSLLLLFPLIILIIPHKSTLLWAQTTPSQLHEAQEVLTFDVRDDRRAAVRPGSGQVEHEGMTHICLLRVGVRVGNRAVSRLLEVAESPLVMQPALEVHPTHGHARGHQARTGQTAVFCLNPQLAGRAPWFTTHLRPLCLVTAAGGIEAVAAVNLRHRHGDDNHGYWRE